MFGRVSCRDLATRASGQNLVFFGAPGVGKGTFAARIAPMLQIPAISTGDIMRAEIKGETELGAKVKEYTDKGQLVPDELVTSIVAKRLKESDAQGGFILDGFPRTVPQAEELGKLIDIDLVVNFELPESVLKRKLLGRRVCADCARGYNVASIIEGDLNMPPLLPEEGDCAQCNGKPDLVTRADDTDEIVTDRLRVYNSETMPVLKHYEHSGKLLHFPVQQGIADVRRLTEEMKMSNFSEADSKIIADSES